jgi:hypothetical protein
MQFKESQAQTFVQWNSRDLRTVCTVVWMPEHGGGPGEGVHGAAE